MKNWEKVIRKISEVNWVGFGIAAAAGISAVISSIDEQKKNKEFTELVERVSNLEKK